MHSEVMNYIIAYFFGSIPFGFLISKVMAGIDIRKTGSGNIGATNVMRSLGKKAAIYTWILDSAKGVIAIQIINNFNFHGIPNLYASAIFAVLGHIFPIWLKFKGGKGVATGGALIVYFSPIVGILTILSWALTFTFSRISSLSAIIACSLAPVYAFFFSKNDYLPLFCFVLSTLIIIKHYQNIVRLFKGQEKGFKK
ncbi:MAG: glycerol-3-phosphate 1-O-acyltransferase PlsY [Sphingobacteriia bacterium]|nr:glycerol-3-phosphate 1-O-acyltransferase PlsY [Sphingobacteriia bacterium]